MLSLAMTPDNTRNMHVHCVSKQSIITKKSLSMRKSCQQHLVSCVHSLRTKNMILESESEQSAA